MDKYLRVIGLLKDINLSTTLAKAEVLTRLNTLIEDNKPFATREDGSKKKLYQGEVNDPDFEFRRKKGFLVFDNESDTMVKVQGTLEETSGGLVIRARVVAQTRQSMIIYMCIPVFALMMATVWEIK